MPAVQRCQEMFGQVAAHAALPPCRPAAPLSLRHDCLAVLVKPAVHMPPGTRVAAVRNVYWYVVNVLEENCTYTCAAATADIVSASQTDSVLLSITRRLRPWRFRQGSWRFTDVRTRPAPGRRTQPRCPPWRRNRRQSTIEADALFVGYF